MDPINCLLDDGPSFMMTPDEVASLQRVFRPAPTVLGPRRSSLQPNGRERAEAYRNSAMVGWPTE